jgi:predicted MFS family arabinose efflux permease
MTYLAEMLGTPLSGWMLEKYGAWTPYILGVTIMAGSATFAFFMPETLEQRGVRQHVHEDDSAEDELRDVDETSQLSTLKNASIWDVVISKAQDFVSSSRFIWKQPRVLVCVLAVFAGSMDKASWYLFIQYIAAKFHMSISRVRSMPLLIHSLFHLETYSYLANYYDFI